MIHLLILAVHLPATIAKLLRSGGVRAVVAESLLLKHQLVIGSRARRRAPSLNSYDLRFGSWITVRFGEPNPRGSVCAAMIRCRDVACADAGR
jgi:hypothetical protein